MRLGSFFPILIVCAVLLLGCLQSRGSQGLDPRVVAIWHKHESVLRTALNGHQRNDEFDRACLFFEQTTGLQMHVNYFTFGVLPTEETDRDLARLQAWYKTNKYRLYWDESMHTVKVRSQ
jgi:hypothetical protein